MRTAFSQFAAALGQLPTQLSLADGVDTSLNAATNTQTLQQFYEAIAHDDFVAVGKLLTPDVSFQIVGAPGVPSEPITGHDAVLAAFQASFAAIEPSQSTVETLVSQGNKLVLIATDSGHYTGTDTPYSFRFLLELTFHEHRMHRIREWVLPPDSLG